MPADYRAIRRENERRYGTGVRDYGGKLLPHRYGDRTHFIYELLQNAEDALARRVSWSGPRSVRFQIGPAELQVRHFGLPFDEADVRSICGIGESTKDSGLTEIGRFGIGFKSVYAYSDRPEVHSGREDLAIEHYVLPAAAPERTPREAEETVFVLPLRTAADAREIRDAVRRLAPRALLFLREIEEIEWGYEGDDSGLYLRETDADASVRRVKLVGEAKGQRETEQAWLVFARALPRPADGVARHVEVAFRLREDGGVDSVPERDTPLFAFFPTTLPTGLRFRVQGPFRTTLARDNVPAGDAWNERLIRTAAEVLIEGLRWLRDRNLLDTEALRVLPLAPDRFPEGSLFAPFREAVTGALRAEPLLPGFGGGFIPGRRARLASPRWLREVFGPEELEALFADSDGAAWLTEDIPAGRTDALSRTLQDEVGVSTLRLDTVLRRLGVRFLESRSDAWVRRLYETFATHGVRRPRVADLPLVRLSDGTHVPPAADGRTLAFLPGPPGNALPGVPVVRQEVLGSPGALSFLRELGLSELDAVERVLRTVAPKYRSGLGVRDRSDYTADIEDLARTYRTASVPERRRLVRALRPLAFVRSLDARGGGHRLSRPAHVWYATAAQQDLFSDLPAVRFVDHGCAVLEEDGVRLLLEACGARPLLEPYEEEQPQLATEDREQIRSRAPGADPAGGIACIEDWNLRGLDALLAGVARMPAAERTRRREMLRRELEGLPEVYDLAVRSGKYECDIRDGPPAAVQVPAAWMRRLTLSAWAPEARPLVRIGPPAPFERPVGMLPAAVRDAPDEAERKRRRDVEEKAIGFILERENWLRTEPDNPGFDLYRRDRTGRTTLRLEVKALSGSLDDFPAQLTPNEFRCAWEHRRSYWLYIVEGLAGEDPQIVRIQDPAGVASRFGFGPEWRGRSQPPP